MSHENVIAAAVQAAVSQGVEATIIVLGGSAAPPAQIPEHITVEHEHYQHSATSGEVAGKVGAYEKRIEELILTLAQRDAHISALQQEADQREAAPATTLSAEAITPAQPEGGVSIDTYSIDVLGIPEEIAAKVRKVYTTIGDLRAAVISGALKEMKLKGGQKAIIDIQERLLGRVPPERIAGATPVAGGGAAATGGGVAEGVPEGHSDRPWLDRLGAVKAKEQDMKDWAAKMGALRAEYPDETAMPDASYDELMKSIKEHDVAKSQVVALVWGLGLDKEHLRGDDGCVDACLRDAGLTHLAAEPTPRVVPEPAPASA